MGTVIEVPRTAALYDPQVRRPEPYGGVSVGRDITYGPSPRHLLDVFTPDGPHEVARPVLLFVHGGAFVRGNRRLGPTSPFYDNVMLWATSQGMVGVNMTYPLAPESPWPGGAAEIGKVVEWLKRNIAKFGGNPEKIYLLGHSAGATHVGTYLAHEFLHPNGGPGLAGALLLSGVYDITPELVAASPTYPQYFGSDIKSYADKSSLAGLIKSKVPLWVARAEYDPTSFVDQARRLREALCGAGRCPATADLSGHTHMSEIFSFNSDDRSVSDAAIRFIRSPR